MNESAWTLIGFAAVMVIVIAGLSLISQHYPIETSFGPYGGIRVSKWYRPEQKRLSSVQTSLLVRVRMTLEGEDLKVMNSILIQFALPGSY